MSEQMNLDLEPATGVPEKEEFKVEVVDDTPPEDRGRTPLPKEVVEELDKDSLDEYSDKVKTRIAQMKKVWHDERREKEAAAREREEALAFAQRTYEENKLLKQRLGQNERVFVDEVKKAASTGVEAAEAAFQRAYESGDAGKIAAAQKALTEAQIKLDRFQNFKPSLQEEDSRVQQPQQTQPPRVQADPKAEAWKQKNTWFGADEEMTALALGLHEKLYRSGVDPRSDDYYRQIDTTMRRRFPEYFGDSDTQTAESPKESPRKASTVVAPATRSTAPRQIRITASEASIAKRMGITPEAYVREKIKLESNNG
jgi:hypothetical protein